LAYKLRDIRTDSNGDLTVDATGDLQLSTPKESVEQMMEFRLRTNAHEFPIHPFIGADLIQFVGKPNTQRTGDKISMRVLEALTTNGFLPAGAVAVDVIPVGVDKVMAIVQARIHIVDEDEDLDNNFSNLFAFTIGLDTYTIQRVTGQIQ
jgi:hypothetical protein